MGDEGSLKLSCVKSIRNFDIKGKMNLKYIKPYKKIEKLNPMA